MTSVKYERMLFEGIKMCIWQFHKKYCVVWLQWEEVDGVDGLLGCILISSDTWGVVLDSFTRGIA